MMETWEDPSEGKSSLFYDMGFPAVGLAWTSKESMQWNMKPSYQFDNMLTSSKDAVQGIESTPETMRKSDPSYPQLDCLFGGTGNCSSFRQPSPPSMITSNSSFGDLESISGPSIASKFNSQKSYLVDLKLGDLANWGGAKNSRISHERPAGLFLSSKRARTASLSLENPICLVQGCHKDLSSAKDYYKRHKVCDVHSKTATVIVNGIEQRFCQQCSRFHLLAEFDDGKRSCRKRLAGHNERRRKPQLDILSGARVLQASLPRGPAFVFPDLPPHSIFSAQGNVQGNVCSHIKKEAGPIHAPQVAMLTMNRPSHTKPIFHPQGLDKQYFSEIFPSRTGHAFLETASTVQELYGLTNSSGALSLLSARSKYLSSPSTGIPMVGEKFPTNGICYLGMNSVEVDQQRPPLIFDSASNAFGFEVQGGWNFQNSDAVRSQNSLGYDKHRTTVDLIQLSLHLRRVEQQRNCMQVKHESDVFSSFPAM